MNKRETHIVTGMTRDLATSRFEPTYVYEAHNIRIRVVGNDSTLLSVTNEKGTEEFELTGSITEIKGTIIGSAAFTNTLVLFTTDTGASEDYIYRVDFDETFDTATISYLFDGGYCHSHGIEGLGFSVLHPIEALAVYENENIQKVYWVDGINQPRMINICKGNQSDNPDRFNFNREIGADAKMVITKYNSGGEFRPGTVQYCFNYFDKFGQETNIVDVSPLYYISPKDSGLAADDVSGCSFTISLSDLNTNFDYIRLYAIYRSSENATPNVRVVGDYKIGTIKDITTWEVDEDLAPFDFSDAYVYNVNTGEIVYKISDVYNPPEPFTGLDISLSLQEALYIESEGYLYAGYYKTDGTKAESVTIFNDDAGIHLIRNNVRFEIRKTPLTDSTTRAVTIIDTGVYGSTIDAEALLFIGGQYVIAETLADKDNTLFLGNLKNVVPNIGDITVNIAGVDVPIKDINKRLGASGLATVESCAFNFNGEKLDSLEPETPITNLENKTITPYEKDNNRASTSIKSFKARENYRLGFIAQYKTGQWSEAVWLGDFTEEEQSGINHFFPSTEYEIDESTYQLTLWGQQFRSAGFHSDILTSVTDALIQNGFIRIAPVVVYPQISDRLVVCQGILCSSVFNIDDRVENAPFAQCDWRFRRGYSWDRIAEEIQLNATQDIAEDLPAEEVSSTHSTYAPEVPFVHFSENGGIETDLASGNYSKYFGTEYYRDPNILTFHSPDIDSSDELISDDVKALKLRIVGYTNGGFYTTKAYQQQYYLTKEIDVKSTIHYHVDIETPGFGSQSELLINDLTRVTPSVLFRYAYTADVLGQNTLVYANYYEYFGGPLKVIGYKDNMVTTLDNKPYTPTPNTYYAWFTYLWHRNGSLNGQRQLTDTDEAQYRTALYRRKAISEKTLCYTTYLKNPNQTGSHYTFINVGTKDINIYNTDTQLIRHSTEHQDDRIYYGNSNKVLIPTMLDESNITFYDDKNGSANTYTGSDTSEGYRVRHAGRYVKEQQLSSVPYGTIILDDDLDEGTDPVEIKYNTTRHAVIALDGSSDSVLVQLGKPINTNNHFVFWLNQNKTFEGVHLENGYYNESSDQQIDYSFIDNCLYIGELYRSMSPEQLASRFGGSTDEAISANVWTFAGESVKLVSGEPTPLLFTEGDTYFGRYDCLKSYPTSQEDKQSIVSIYSTELESRVNLDFRYGNTMNLDDNTLVTPQNFNLYNHGGYEQTNQYFTFKAIDYDRYLDQNFPNMITWSKEKTLGEDIDTWTSIPMLSTLDLDGTKGEITKLVRFNNEILAFQDNAFAQILFNSRVQIPVSDGVPVEITNGYKVDGKRYISESIGMSNKWSMAVSPYALYFADDSKNSLYAYNGQLTDLSSSKGMKTWMYDKGNDFRPVWNPRDYGNLRTFYDKIYGDVYFTTKNTSLVYSEQIGNFTSFMDYGGVTSMNNMGNKFLSFTTSDNDNSKMWEMWEGDYNMFFDEFKPYWMTFIANENPTKDKIFNNLEWRSVVYDKDGNYLPYSTFDTMRIWHEHQDTGCINLKDNIGIPSSLKKKFNAFRTYIPRDAKGLWSPPNMQRIRNPWTYIRLAKIEENTDQMIFTDLNVDFFE